MNPHDNWLERYEKEIARGERAKVEGNEGMARVCARRAAGVVVQEYLRREAKVLPRLSTVLVSGASALNHLKFFADDPEMPGEARERARHFFLQLLKEHTLPGNPDLLADAAWLREHLL